MGNEYTLKLDGPRGDFRSFLDRGGLLRQPSALPYVSLGKATQLSVAPRCRAQSPRDSCYSHHQHQICKRSGVSDSGGDV